MGQCIQNNGDFQNKTTSTDAMYHNRCGRIKLFLDPEPGLKMPLFCASPAIMAHSYELRLEYFELSTIHAKQMGQIIKKNMKS